MRQKDGNIGQLHSFQRGLQARGGQVSDCTLGDRDLQDSVTGPLYQFRGCTRNKRQFFTAIAHRSAACSKFVGTCC